MAEPRICVVAVDDSEDSDFAINWFCKHIYRKGDEAVLVYVPEGHGLLHASKWENAVYSLNRDVAEPSEEEQKQIKTSLSKFARKLKQHGVAGRVRNVMAHKPEDGILRAAEEENAEMIVVGSRGRGAFHRTFLGSICDYMIHHSPIPVVVCNHPHPHHRKISPSALFCACTSAYRD